MTTDIEELCKRLEALFILDEVGSNNPLARDAATLLRAQAQRIAELEANLTPRIVEKLRTALKDEGHAYEESLAREDGWIARCDELEAKLAAQPSSTPLVEGAREALIASIIDPVSAEGMRQHKGKPPEDSDLAWRWKRALGKAAHIATLPASAGRTECPACWLDIEPEQCGSGHCPKRTAALSALLAAIEAKEPK